MVKLKPHHPLVALKLRFSDPLALEITTTALLSAAALDFDEEAIVDVVQALEAEDFVESETAHNPPNSKVWHDTYKTPFASDLLYLKFAGQTLIDVTLVSFKRVT